MKRIITSALAIALAAQMAAAQEFERIPFVWKWISGTEVAFTYDGTFNGDDDFSVSAPNHIVNKGVKAPAKFAAFPVNPDGAVNLTYSPDSTMLGFTRDNDLYVVDIATGAEKRLTFDGSDLILNGYASWVYYEEILGRPSRYRSFWWSPDSKKIGFYRSDNTAVPMFPIYSAKGQDGSLNQTRYPKAGETNPEVRVGMVDVSSAFTSAEPCSIVWADFDYTQDQYFGIPFWGADSKDFYVAREPRVQNTLDLFAVSAADGSKKQIYHETYPTWLDWIEDIYFAEKGLYMARSFETGWQQIYFLSYDGKELRRLTDGPNWRVGIQRVDEKTGSVYYTACREASTRYCLYRADADGTITALTDPDLSVQNVSFSPDGKYFVCSLSNFTTPTQIWLYETRSASASWKARRMQAAAPRGRRVDDRAARAAFKVADMKGADYDPSRYALQQLITIKAEDGLEIPATIAYPVGFDASKKYPVHVNIYGGPDTPVVRERWVTPNPVNQWWSDNGIIEVYADSRAAGHNGRAGLDKIHRNLTEVPVRDFTAWAEYFKTLPYVMPDKIGVEGFSFGGTMTTMLLCRHSDSFHYGIAGGGVYDWIYYDTHYTERFMDTPQNNPQGYADARTLNYVDRYPVTYSSDGSKMLRITHGTGDDNVHFQNTLQLVNDLEEKGKNFELYIYPDGMHGYRGLQHMHDQAAARAFWLKNLKGE